MCADSFHRVPVLLLSLFVAWFGRIDTSKLIRIACSVLWRAC